MKRPDEVSVREWADDAWKLYFGFVKCGLKLLFGTVYLAALALAMLAGLLFRGAQALYVGIDAWAPVRPAIFEVPE